MSLRQHFELGPKAVTIAATVVGEFLGIDGGDVLNIEVENAGAVSALDLFTVQLKDHEDGAWYDFLTTTAWDTADPDGVVGHIWSSTDLMDLAASSTAHAILRIGAAWGIRFQAAVVGAGAETTNVNIKGRFTAA